MRKIRVKQKDIWEMLVNAHYRHLTRPDYSSFVRYIIEDIEKENNIKVELPMVHKLDKRYQKFRKEETKKFEKIFKMAENGEMYSFREIAENMGIERSHVGGFRSQYTDWIKILKKLRFK
jgi:mRNA-degrading endonuclease RelE of RelBE toxin-antitoxin system